MAYRDREWSAPRPIHADPESEDYAHQWVDQEIAHEEDGRGLPVEARAQGCDLLNQIGPSWRKAQTRTQKLIGDGAALLRKLASNRIEASSGRGRLFGEHILYM